MASNEMVDIRALGLLVLANDVTPQLAQETIASINVYGVLRACKEVKEALAYRMK